MLEYNPFAAEVIDNPHAIYARLREEAPCYYIRDCNAWALSPEWVRVWIQRAPALSPPSGRWG